MCLAITNFDYMVDCNLTIKNHIHGSMANLWSNNEQGILWILNYAIHGYIITLIVSTQIWDTTFITLNFFHCLDHYFHFHLNIYIYIQVFCHLHENFGHTKSWKCIVFQFLVKSFQCLISNKFCSFSYNFWN